MRENREIFSVIAAMFLILGIIVGVPSLIWHSTATTTTITVTEKERVNYDNNSKYLVWTEQGEVFENTDSLLFLKFNSSDLYGKLKQGQTYCVQVAGWRVPFLSMYRDIIKIVNTGPCESD